MRRNAWLAAAAAFLSAAFPIRAQHLALDFSTYLGGPGNDRGTALSVGPGGDIFLAGTTDSADFPTRDPFQPSLTGSQDAFVSRLSSSGSGFIYSTYLGGGLADQAHAIAADSNGIATVSGQTVSNDFPTVNSYQASRAGYTDVFLSRLSSTGSALVYSTYLGGTSHDYATELALDADGGTGVTGYTQSGDFPVPNAYQSSNRGGTYDAFISRLSSAGSSLVYSTYLGGSGIDWGQGIVCDSENRAWVVGYTASGDFPTRDPYQASFGGGDSDIFVGCLSSTGSLLIYSTYLGGGGKEDGYGLCRDSLGAVYVIGSSGSDDFPTRNPYQAARVGYTGKTDVVISAFDPSGSSLLYSTYFGGSEGDSGFGIALDPEGRICVTGVTYSTDFPVRVPYQGGMAGSTDVIVSRFSSSGSALDYSTYLGGSGEDTGWAIGLDAAGNACVTGRTSSGDFPVSNAYQSTHGGSEDAFLARLRYAAPTPPPYVLDSGDYNGDGTSDVGIFRAIAGLWSVREITRAYFGSTDDIPAPGDYNADGTSDVALFRGDGGLWSVRNLTRFYFGLSTDCPAPGDYDGDGRTEAGVFRAAGGEWMVRNLTRVYFGASGDIPVPGDFDGNGTKEAAVFRPSSLLWAVRDLTRCYFGSGGDATASADYNGDGRDEVGIFRGAAGLWSVRNLTRVYFGGSGDVPVTR